MRKCLRCDTEMIENLDVKVEGGAYGIKVTQQGIFKDNLGKLKCAVCPNCGETMEVNFRKDDYFVEDDNWHKLHKNYEDFINKYKDKKILLLELGVGFNTPGIIRFPFEEMTAKLKNTTLIRVNEKYLESFYDIKEKTILIKDDCKNFLTKLKEK